MEQYHFMSRTKGNDCHQACGRYYTPSTMRVHELVLRTVMVSYSHDFFSTSSHYYFFFFFLPIWNSKLDPSYARQLILIKTRYPTSLHTQHFSHYQHIGVLVAAVSGRPTVLWQTGSGETFMLVVWVPGSVTQLTRELYWNVFFLEHVSVARI